MSQLDDFRAAAEAAINAEDIAKLEELQSQFIELPSEGRPFEPAIGLADPTKSGADPAFEGEGVMALANSIARKKRSIQYKLKLAGGYDGPIIVSEGDSWFQYPIRLDDVIDVLSENYAVHSLGAAGDTLSNMLAHREFVGAIVEQNADVFLFSAGGNDIVGGGDIAKLLQPYRPGAEARELINETTFNQALSRIVSGFEQIINLALSAKPTLHVLIHGYDRVVPRKDGKWLHVPMNKLGIPKPLQTEVAGILIDRLNRALEKFETRFAGRVTHVDCRGYVGANEASWFDELHPKNPGYRRVADLFDATIKQVLSQQPLSGLTAAAAIPAHEAILSEAEPAAAPVNISPSTAPITLSAFDREAYASYLRAKENGLNEPPSRLETRRELLSSEDLHAFERILGRNNLFPVNYLERGAEAAKAVVKVQVFWPDGKTPHSSGSGFFIAPSLLMTNNHVLPSREMAVRSWAWANYAVDSSFQPMAVERFKITPNVFYTSPSSDLDFTIVSVEPVSHNGMSISDFGTLVLVDRSGKAVVDEFVSCIQHPNGDLKTIALRESRVIGYDGDFVYYNTDTDRGASGSPILNDDWQPVGLHHMAVRDINDPNKFVANRGIRISSICARLKRDVNRDRSAGRIVTLLNGEPMAGNPTSPDPRLVHPQEGFDAFVDKYTG